MDNCRLTTTTTTTTTVDTDDAVPRGGSWVIRGSSLTQRVAAGAPNYSHGEHRRPGRCRSIIQVSGSGRTGGARRFIGCGGD